MCSGIRVSSEFYVNFTWLFSFFSGLLDLIESHSFSHSLRDLFPLHKLDHRVILGRSDGYGRVRVEWV